jgi:ribosomal protein S6E (S10)
VTDEKGAPDAKGRLGSLSYRVIIPKGWINLESDDGLCARVLVRGRTVTSEDVSVNLLGSGSRATQWRTYPRLA